MTDKIKHHLSDELLMGYSAGTLPEAFSLMVAAHVSLCDECRARLEAFDAIGGALLDADAGQVELEFEDKALEAVFATIDGSDQPKTTAPEVTCSVLPAPILAYVGGDVSSIKWRSVGRGVKQAILPTSKDASARLLYIPAGAAVPDHGHAGNEITMVLQGGYSDEMDHFIRGDVEIADEDLNHTPVADMNEDCICLAVTDAPLKFNSFVPRLLQPLLRI